ncbi:zinc metalloproteinase nas-4 isoform X1 [Amyelois transitella]|uniref:zinc metalloproteinase nas-4 isoform X1 n=2 Tax=Amyelois transitella TaxID=680683 RepID=UPI00298F6B42|nr:zinc metalloproteinase nas-4 isoform X1 [Amyelois transitella]
MKLIHGAILLACFLAANSWPVGDVDTVELIPMDDNSIDNFDSDTIDLTQLGPEAFGSPSNKSGESLSTWNETSLMNPEEMGEYAEGDILIPKTSAQGRNGIRHEAMRWPDGVIPYSLEGYFSSEQRDLIMQAIDDYHRMTCLHFVPRSRQTDYIVIQNKNTGCWSSVGRIGGRQEVNLQSPGCLTKKGTVLHELLHAIGFMHEQSRPERDDFVTVWYSNVKPGSENNFKKADKQSVNDYGVGYDYNSVMHYSEYAFSKNRQKTIEPKVGGFKLGQREGLSRGDVKKVNAMYNCKKTGSQVQAENAEQQGGNPIGSFFQNLLGIGKNDTE